jgi:hypothetical protein
MLLEGAAEDVIANIAAGKKAELDRRSSVQET